MLDFYYQELGEDKEILVFSLSGRLDTTQCDYLYGVIEKQIEKGMRGCFFRRECRNKHNLLGFLPGIST